MKSVWAGVIAALTLLFTDGFAVSANKEKLNVKTTPPHPAMEKALFCRRLFLVHGKALRRTGRGSFGDIGLSRDFMAFIN